MNQCRHRYGYRYRCINEVRENNYATDRRRQLRNLRMDLLICIFAKEAVFRNTIGRDGTSTMLLLHPAGDGKFYSLAVAINE